MSNLRYRFKIRFLDRIVGPVQQQLARALVSFKVVRQDRHEHFHGQRFTVKDVVLDGRHGVSHGPQADPLDVGGIISCAAIVIVSAGGYAVINEER